MLIKGYSQWLCLFYCVIDDETMAMSGVSWDGFHIFPSQHCRLAHCFIHWLVLEIEQLAKTLTHFDMS